MVPYRETIARSALLGERKYVCYLDGRTAIWRILELEILPRPGESPSVTAAEGLPLPADCVHTARAALFERMDRGPLRGFPMIGLEVRLVAATYLPPLIPTPKRSAAAASMALDEAMIRTRRQLSLSPGLASGCGSRTMGSPRRSTH